MYLLFIQQLPLKLFSAFLTHSLICLASTQLVSLALYSFSPSFSLFLPDFTTVMVFLSSAAKCLELIKFFLPSSFNALWTHRNPLRKLSSFLPSEPFRDSHSHVKFHLKPNNVSMQYLSRCHPCKLLQTCHHSLYYAFNCRSSCLQLYLSLS